jgi:hypothetical protein
MLDGQRYFAHYPDEDPATARKPLMSAELIKALATIEKEIRHCLTGGDAGRDAGEDAGSKAVDTPAGPSGS